MSVKIGPAGGWTRQPNTPYYGRTDSGSPLNSRPAGSVWIAGTVEEGQTLTCNNNLTDADTLGTLHYQWVNETDGNVGTDSSSYTLVTADVGDKIHCVISYTDGSAQAETKTSSSTITVAGTGSTPSWQLDAGHYMPAKMAPVLIYPRPDTETNSDAYHRNAYNDGSTSLAWEIPIVVQGGSWPLYYEVDATSAAKGISIGDFLVVDVDVLIDDGTYGVLSWSAPTVGTHTITVTVTDQDGTSVNVTWDLVVGSANHIFVNASASSEGAGTLADPLKTIGNGVMENNDTANSFLGKVVHFRTGTYVVNNGTSGVNTKINNTYKPRSYVAYPGESVIFDTTDASFWTNGTTDDFFVGGITFDGTKTTAANNKAILLETGSDRGIFYKLNFTNHTPGSVGNDNPACIAMMSGAVRNYIAVVRCSIGSGTTIQLHVNYTTDYLVSELNTCNSATVAASNGGYFIHPKHTNNYVTVRANQAIGTTVNGNSIIEFGNGGSSSHAESCWNTVHITHTDSTSGGERWNTSTSASGTDLHSYRNNISVTGGRAYRGYSTAASPPAIDKNAIYGETGTGITPDYMNDLDNQILSASDFDANGDLTGSARTSYLGLYGSGVI